jgi:hypothetical protein
MSENGFFMSSIEPFKRSLDTTIDTQEKKRLVKEFLEFSFKKDIEEKAKRFLEIERDITPTSRDYFKLYWELRQLYINGHFYSAAVLCGVLCERICYDILSLQGIAIDGKLLSKEQIALLYKINLVDIIRLLREWNLIKEETEKEMLKVNDKRNQYVHPSRTRLNAQRDSLEMINRICAILENEFEMTTT